MLGQNTNCAKRGQAPELHTQDGFMLILLVVCLLMLFAFTSIAIDVGQAYSEQRRIHLATDAGAIAGAALLVKAGSTDTQLKTEARLIARENGLTDAEIDAGGVSGVDVGNWDTVNRIFVPNATPRNAVRVNAQRTLPGHFIRTLGWDSLRPKVGSIAIAAGAGNGSCPVPFGIQENTIAGLTYGDTVTIVTPSPGNWGKLDIGGNMSSGPNFVAAMRGDMGCTPIDVGQTLFSPGTGFAQVRQAFEERMAVNPHITVAIVQEFFNGNHDVTVLGFISVIILDVRKAGKNWSVDFQLEDAFVGTTGGGPAGIPYAKARVMVY